MTDQATFISMVRAMLGRGDGPVPVPAPETGLSVTRHELRTQAEHVRAEMARRSGALMDAFAGAAEKNAWRIARAKTNEDAAAAVAAICRKAGVKTVLRSAQNVFTRAPVDRALQAEAIELTVLAGGAQPGLEGPDEVRRKSKTVAFSAGAGITGADYAIAETGTIALHPRPDLSRLVSLAPPLHIAIVERGSVLPSLDELFILEREALLDGRLSGSMNLISGPSRTGDIEATVVQGIHGPLETYAVLVG